MFLSGLSCLLHPSLEPNPVACSDIGAFLTDPRNSGGRGFVFSFCLVMIQVSELPLFSPQEYGVMFRPYQTKVHFFLSLSVSLFFFSFMVLGKGGWFVHTLVVAPYFAGRTAPDFFFLPFLSTFVSVYMCTGVVMCCMFLASEI